MRILLTGATGRVGPAVIERLQANHDVTVIGRRERVADDVIKGATYVSCDIEDYELLVALCQGQDAIVHLAAIADPGRVPDQDTFRINTAGTFNIFQAAVETGISRVVQASSINAIGYGHALRPVEPVYFPIDERHPTHPLDPYSLSKTVIEDVGRYFWERHTITSFALRLPGVLNPTPERLAQLARRDRATLEESLRLLEAMPVPERVAFMAEHHRISREGRRERFRRLRAGLPLVDDPRSKDPRWVALGQRGGFFTQLDARDGAQAIERCLATELTGSHALFINDDRNALGMETERLLEICFPNVRNRKLVYQGDESLVSADRAKYLVGFAPEHHLADTWG